MSTLENIPEEVELVESESKDIFVHGKNEIVFCTPAIHVFRHVVHYLKEFKKRGQKLNNVIVLTTPKRLIQWRQASSALNQIFDDANFVSDRWSRFTNASLEAYKKEFDNCLVVLDRVNSTAIINKDWFNNMMLCHVVIFTMNQKYIPEILKALPTTSCCMYKTVQRAKYESYVDKVLFHPDVTVDVLAKELKRLHSNDEVLYYVKDHNLFQTYSLLSSYDTFVDCKTVSVSEENLTSSVSLVPNVEVNPHLLVRPQSDSVDLNRVHVSISCVLAPFVEGNMMYNDVLNDYKEIQNESDEKDKENVLKRLYVEFFHFATKQYLSRNAIVEKIATLENEAAVDLEDGNTIVQYTFKTKLRNRALFMNLWYYLMDVYKKKKAVSRWFVQFD